MAGGARAGVVRVEVTAKGMMVGGVQAEVEMALEETEEVQEEEA